MEIKILSPEKTIFHDFDMWFSPVKTTGEAYQWPANNGYWFLLSELFYWLDRKILNTPGRERIGRLIVADSYRSRGQLDTYLLDATMCCGGGGECAEAKVYTLANRRQSTPVGDWIRYTGELKNLPLLEGEVNWFGGRQVLLNDYTTRYRTYRHLDLAFSGRSEFVDECFVAAAIIADAARCMTDEHKTLDEIIEQPYAQDAWTIRDSFRIASGLANWLCQKYQADDLLGLYRFCCEQY